VKPLARLHVSSRRRDLALYPATLLPILSNLNSSAQVLTLMVQYVCDGVHRARKYGWNGTVCENTMRRGCVRCVRMWKEVESVSRRDSHAVARISVCTRRRAPQGRLRLTKKISNTERHVGKMTRRTDVEVLVVVARRS
jgi:hypothetical protein